MRADSVKFYQKSNSEGNKSFVKLCIKTVFILPAIRNTICHFTSNSTLNRNGKTHFSYRFEWSYRVIKKAYQSAFKLRYKYLQSNHLRLYQQATNFPIIVDIPSSLLKSQSILHQIFKIYPYLPSKYLYDLHLS